MSDHAMSRQELTEDIRQLGIGPGDTVLVRGALRSLGNVEGDRAREFIGALLDVVGTTGTLAGLAFTRSFLRPGRHPDHVFNRQTAPITGGLAAAMVRWPGAVRSLHPTNSFVAIGGNADDLVRGHDHSAPSFYPIKSLLKHDGKMLLVGCLHSSPGFSTVHWAQHELGLSVRSIMLGRQKVFYDADGDVRLFRNQDVAGCSLGFDKFYGHYEKYGALASGRIGDAESIAIKAREAYAVEKQLIAADPRFALCDRPTCFSCRATWFYNMRDWPLFWLRSLPRAAARLLAISR